MSSSTATPLVIPPKALRKLDDAIPPLLRPLIRAYVLGYASAVTPRVLTLVMQYVNRRRKGKGTVTAKVTRSFIASLQRILRGGLELRRFPAFCAALVGGSTLLEVLLGKVLSRLLNGQLTSLVQKRLARGLSGFVAAWLSLQLLQSSKSDEFLETASIDFQSKQVKVEKAGRTLDLTLFAATRALDVIVGELWARAEQHRPTAGQRAWVESMMAKIADPSVFAASSSLIMWAWFYAPFQLPKSYQKWIEQAAAVDPRLVEALRLCRSGEIRYGEDTGKASLLESMCADFKWPLEWGDPFKSIPFPCEMVHMGSGPSCERHAISRFYNSFKWSMATYFPLSFAGRKKDLGGLKKSLLSSARSSSFLAAFIALFYYGVCLARTRIGPHILGKDTKCRQMIDEGLCVGSGCFMCGWSIFLETVARQKELALFVAPKALATLLPRRYSTDKQWRETFVFAFSSAVVFTFVRENPKRVRGILGNVMGSVLEP